MGEVVNFDNWQSKLIWKDKNKTILEPRSRHNARLILAKSDKFKDLFRYDIFNDRIMVYRQPLWDEAEHFTPRPLSEYDVIQICCILELEGMQVGKEVTRDAILLSAKLNQINPPRDYFSSLVWDGTERLKNWLTYYLGAEKQDREYLEAVGKMWLTAGIARVMMPGCKFDHMLVLEGEQGVKKSMALAVLATVHGVEYFTDRITFNNLNNANSMMMLQGKIIVEFAELVNLNNRDFEEVKQWITLRTDEARKPYEREPTPCPRQFILAGTTNNTSWIRDVSGGRRFWPVVCGESIDIDALERDKEQLWAEAYHLWKSGFCYWVDNKDKRLNLHVKAEQALRIDEDIWSYTIERFLSGRTEIRADEILLDCLGIQTGRQTRTDKIRVNTVLRSMGFKEGFSKRPGKKRQRCWIKS